MKNKLITLACSILVGLAFVSAPVLAKTTSTTMQIGLADQKEECSSAVVKGNSEYSDEYLFWADDLADAVGKSVPYKSAGNIFVDVPEEYKEKITGELVEAVSPYFSNQSFSISERGSSTVPAKFGGYRLIYSTSGETVYEKVNDLGIIQNVPVHFVRAGNVKYTEMGIVEGSIVLSPEKAFSSKQEAVEAMERKKGYSNAKVYKAENYAFEYEDNSIVSLSGAAVAELYSYRPAMTVKDDSEVISEGIHVVEWKYDSKVFAEPITWYEVYVGVPEDVLLKEVDRSEESLISEKTYNNNSANEIQKEAKHKANPLLFVLFIIATVLVVLMVIRKKAHENVEPEQETFYYSGNEFDENIIDVEYKEVDDEKD